MAPIPCSGPWAGRRHTGTALTEVGGFDERLFAYGEDVDLALRLREAGWSCVAAPDAVGLHLGSESFGYRSELQVYHLGWSRAYLLRKYGLLRDPRRWPGAIIGDGGSVAWQLLRKRDLSGLRGRLSGWRAAPSRHEVPDGVVNPDIGLAEGVRRRRAYRGI